MYMLKFFKWFWNSHLNDPMEKTGFLLICACVIFLLSAVLSLIFANPLIMGIAIIFMCSIGAIIATISAVKYIRNTYFKWQQETIDALRGK